MSDRSDAPNTAFARVVALTWRGVWLNLIIVTLAGVSLGLGTYHRPFPWTGAFSGVIIALSGYQLWIADGRFTRLASGRGHRWVRPLAFALLATGMVLLAFGMLTGVRRIAALN